MFLFFFFFQAEDGIRDLTVTGVQTCALPIYFAGATHLTFEVGGTPTTIETIESKGAAAAKCQGCLLKMRPSLVRREVGGDGLRLEFLVLGSEMRTRTKQLDV